MPPRLLLLGLLLTVACVHPAPPAPPAAPEPAASAPASAAPTLTPPFSPAQLAAAFPDGTTLRLQITEAGGPPVVQRWVFTGGDAEGTTIQSTVSTPSGTLLKDEGAERSTWVELSRHAAFPAADTTVGDSEVTVAAGHFATWLYTVRATAEDGTPVLKRYHFARTVPGPPVLFTIQQGGTELFRMELLERTGPG